MGMDTMIGVDLAKSVFQVHGASMIGQVRFRRKLSRQAFRAFMAEQPAAVVVMEACGSASYWAREMVKLGHEVRLIAPQYVRPFVKRQKNDAADAEAIVIAAQRPEMRFVQPKSEDQQACAVLFRARERLLHQRTELVNALRSVLYEYGQNFVCGDRYIATTADNAGRHLVEDRGVGRPTEAELVQPLQVLGALSLLARIDLADPQQERPDLLALAGPVLHGRLACTYEIAHRLMGLVRRPYLGQFPRPEQARQLHGVPSVRLDPLAGAARDQRRCDHRALMPEFLDQALQTVASWPSLIAKPQP